MRTILIAVAAISLIPASGCDSRPTDPVVLGAGEPLPNVVFIMIDTLRADRLGVLGSDLGLTPAIDAMAQEGVLFERASAAAPWTQPSIASVFTGRYPAAHKAGDYRGARDASAKSIPAIPTLAGEFRTLAEHLGDAGYETAGFVSNQFVAARFGFGQGFGHYDTTFAANETAGSVINAAALAWLDDRKQASPFFLYLHYMDPHSPYTDDPRFLDPSLDRLEEGEPDRFRLLTSKQFESLGHHIDQIRWPGGIERHSLLVNYLEYWQARYDAGVEQIDSYLGELRSDLVDRALWDDAYVIVASDHGEAFQEHGFWDHGHTVHEVELHVPFILRWPGKLTAGRRVRQEVSLVDLLPTLLDQLRLDLPRGLQGGSLVPLLEGARLDERPIFGEHVRVGPEQKAVRSGRWKLIEALPIGSKPELYDLARDPGETNNLAERDPDRVLELRRMIEAHLESSAEMHPQAESPLVPLTTDDIERLKALGYLD
jgi:arylsulfatase